MDVDLYGPPLPPHLEGKPPIQDSDPRHHLGDQQSMHESNPRHVSDKAVIGYPVTRKRSEFLKKPTTNLRSG